MVAGAVAGAALWAGGSLAGKKVSGLFSDFWTGKES
jgi:hypothetical protein